MLMVADVSEKDVLELLESRVITLKSELKRAEEALTALQGKPASGNAKRSEPPPVYDIHYKWDKKILYVLSKTGPAYKEDIVKEVSKLESKPDSDKLINLIGVKLSTLLKQGVINARREGRKFKYQLNNI
jgi:hypothetical protein